MELNRREALKTMLAGAGTLALGQQAWALTQEKPYVSPFVNYCEQWVSSDITGKLERPFCLRYPHLAPFIPHKHQEQLAEVFDKNNRVLVKKYRNGGFSTCAALYALHACITKPYQSWAIVSKTYQESKAWSEFIGWQNRYRHITGFGFSPKGFGYVFGNGNILVVTSELTSIYSPARNIIVDEAAFMQDRHVKRLEGFGDKIFLISTVKGKSGRFYEVHQDALAGKNDYKVFAPNCYEHPKYTSEQLAKWNHWGWNPDNKYFRQECLGEFGDY